MRLGGEKKGQFIIIAALMMAIMIISISSIIYSSVTYFKHERWEEYVVLIDSVKTGTSRVVEISVANHTQTSSNTILRDNLDKWASDVKRAYPGFGVVLTSTLPNASIQVYGVTINYNIGLARTWNQQVSFSAANATFNLNLASAGLTGYSFSAHAFLKMNITDALWYKDSTQVGVRVIIEAEGHTPVTNLRANNFLLFQVNGLNQTFTWYRYYESKGHSGYPPLNAFVYELRYTTATKPPSVSVVTTVRDVRGVQVTGAVNNLAVIDA